MVEALPPLARASNWGYKMGELDFASQPLRREPERYLWATIYSSVLAAILTGGVLLGLGVRLYVYWSVRDSVNSMNKAYDERKKDGK